MADKLELVSVKLDVLSERELVDSELVLGVKVVVLSLALLVSVKLELVRDSVNEVLEWVSVDKLELDSVAEVLLISEVVVHVRVSELQLSVTLELVQEKVLVVGLVVMRAGVVSGAGVTAGTPSAVVVLVSDTLLVVKRTVLLLVN